jgi:hypothetical protein
MCLGSFFPVEHLGPFTLCCFFPNVLKAILGDFRRIRSRAGASFNVVQIILIHFSLVCRFGGRNSALKTWHIVAIRVCLFNVAKSISKSGTSLQLWTANLLEYPFDFPEPIQPGVRGNLSVSFFLCELVRGVVCTGWFCRRHCGKCPSMGWVICYRAVEAVLERVAAVEALCK